jgi:putative inorganic carbon (HCO3(-)) transporter
MHLTNRLPALGVLRVDLLLVMLITGLLLVTPQEAPPKGNGRIRALILGIAAYALVTVPFVEWPGTVLFQGLPNFIKAFVFYYFTTQLVTTEGQLRKLILVFVAGQSLRVLEPLYLHVTEGYWGSFTMMAGWETMDRLSGAPSDVINPNGLAFVILTIIPLLHYLGPMTRLGGLFYIAFLPLASWALLLTASRSGMLGMAVTLLLIWWKSRRKALLAAVIVIGGVVGAQFLTANQIDRYTSIFSKDTKNAATAEGRMDGVTRDLMVALRRPVFGHGLGTSYEANTHFNVAPEVSHNLYTEVAIELGFVGLAIFVVFLVTVARTASRTLKALRQAGMKDGLTLRLSLAVQVFFGMNILFSFASYGLSSYEWYFLAGLCEVLPRLSGAAAVEPGPVAKAPAMTWRPRPAALAPVGRSGYSQLRGPRL